MIVQTAKDADGRSRALEVLWVDKVLGGSELQSHGLFAVKFGRPGKGNDKGNVEGLVGYARRNFLVPVPRVASWEELNAHLVEECRRRRERKVWGQEETIGQRFECDRERLLALPATPYEACEKRTTRVKSQALVRYATNDYSVPVEDCIGRCWLKRLCGRWSSVT